MTQLEKDIERKLRLTVTKYGGKCLKWVCPGWSGVPDRIILLPGGRILFAELKRPKGGVVSPMQAWWRVTLQQMGFTVLHLYTQKDITNAALIIDALMSDE